MFRKLGHIYVFQNVHIALCALVFYLGATFQNGTLVCLIAGFIFLATWIYYSGHRILSRHFSEPSQLRYQSWQKLSRTWKLIFLAIISILILIFFKLNLRIQFFFILNAMICLIYTFPKSYKIKVRRFPVIKLGLISVVWASVFMLGVSPSLSFELTNSLLFLEKFFFIFALTIPCDWRDRNHDYKINTVTLATLYDHDKNIKFIRLLLLLCIVIVGVNYIFGNYSFPLTGALIALYFFQFWLSLYLMKRDNEFLYLFLLDGLILVNGLAHILISIIR